MRRLIERAYLASPPLAQDAMVSLYGVVLYARRLAGRSHREAIEQIKALEATTPSDLLQVQRRLLRRTIERAAQSVPHYREVFSHLGVDPSSIDTLERLRCLPLLEKQTVRQQPELFYSETSKAPYSISTSGTSGSPLVVRCTRDALVQNYAHLYRLRERLGIKRRDRCATFAGRVLLAPTRSTPPYWRRNAVTNTTLYSTYHLSAKTLPAYLEHLAAQQPSLIDAYPSALTILASGLRERPDLEVHPTAIITSSETLLPSQRALAESAFGCRVTDQYGSAEMTAFIAQCDRGTYHVWGGYGIAEVLTDGRPARVGETGELVTTGLINDAMPLIRYRTGDLVVLADGCSCGLPFTPIERIEGRQDDILVTPDGRRVGRLDPVFKGLPSDAFREVQIVQTALDSVEVRFVAGSRFAPEFLRVVVRQLQDRLGPSMFIETAQLAGLPRGANGKVRAVVGLKPGPRSSTART